MAIRELEAALDCIARDKLEAAEKHGRTSHTAAGHLAASPDLRRVVLEVGDPFLRELIHLPFRVMYERGRGVGRTLAIFRCEPQPDIEETQSR